MTHRLVHKVQLISLLCHTIMTLSKSLELGRIYDLDIMVSLRTLTIVELYASSNYYFIIEVITNCSFQL